jgi:hypothetical protein
MARAVQRRRPANVGRRPRRRVEFARRRIDSLGVTSGTAQLYDLLATFQTELGITSMLPGTTIMGIRYQIWVSAETAAKAGVNLTWGFITGPDTLDLADVVPDVDASLHLDWMQLMYRSVEGGLSAVSEGKNLVGNGDEGYATVRSRRKLEGLNDTLWLSLVPVFSGSGTLAIHVYTAVALALP